MYQANRRRFELYFDPNKNKVVDTFKEAFTDYGNVVDKIIRKIFGGGGVRDETIIKPSHTFFEKTLPDIGNKIDTGFKQKLADPADIFFHKTLPTGANQFFDDFKNHLPSHLPIIGKILPHSPSLSSPSSTLSQGLALNHSIVLTKPTEESKNSYIVPFIVGGAIFAYILYQK